MTSNWSTRSFHSIFKMRSATLKRFGLIPGEIHAVVHTGGSARIPCFVEMLERVFGPEKVVLTEVFTSMTVGLAIRAGMDKG